MSLAATAGALPRVRGYVADRLVLLTYLVSLLGTVGMVALAWHALQKGRESDQWPMDAAEAIAGIVQLHLKFVEAESAGRAFLSTPNRSALGAMILTPAFVCSGRLLEARRKTEATAVHLAYHDLLTGLPIDGCSMTA
jgi:hypothetical protein